MFRRILVPIDGSPTSKRGLEEAIGLARNQKARIGLVHVVDDSHNGEPDGCGLGIVIFKADPSTDRVLIVEELADDLTIDDDNCRRFAIIGVAK